MTALKRITDNHVSKLNGIARTGNKTFRDQIVTNGPIMSANETNTATKTIFAKSPILFS